MELSQKERTRRDLVRICTEKDINIDIEGYKNFDPTREDPTTQIHDFFPQAV